MKRTFVPLLLWAAGTLGPVHAQSLIVSAAASLKDALTAVNATFQAAQPGIKIAVNYGASGALQHQIEHGAPADVFISAAAKPMDALAAQGLLLKGTRADLLTNTLVLIGPPGAKVPKDFPGLTAPEVRRIAVGEPKSVPAGQYAEEIFAHFGITGAVAPKLVFAKDVRAVLTYTETGNVDAGIVYLTDARHSKSATILASAPDDAHQPVTYPAAIIASSKHPEAARAYLRFLCSEEAEAIFKSFGFGIPGC